MPEISTYSLAPFKGNLEKEHVLHLLRRTLFGVGHKEFSFFKNKKLEQCIDILLKQSPAPNPVLQGDEGFEDPLVPKGKTWVNAPYENTVINTRRELMLKMWWIENIVKRDYSLTEKMTLFWHNHFVIEMDTVKDSRYAYRYAAMLRAHSLGNFKKLIREGTTNIAMLVYLNGNANSKTAPNENYGRELLELFTLGKSKDVHYTEDDVKAAARVLSGWKDNKETLQSEFIPALHDTGNKQFSSYFNSKIIKGKTGNEGQQEIDEMIEMIFAKRDTAKFVCRNLYRWFVSAHINEQVESQVIAPLAQCFFDNNFEITPVLKKLLSSEHFFDPVFRGCIVKSPIDFFLGSMQQFDVVHLSNLQDNHEIWIDFYVNTGFLSMDIGNPPSVAGWPAYYQAPKYHQWWINSSSLGLRLKIMSDLCSTKGLFYNGFTFSFMFLPFVSQFENPANADKLIEDCVHFICAAKIANADKKVLKSILLSGQQSDYYWQDAWNKYADNPADMTNKNVVETRLRAFFVKLLNMPEYQMM